MNPCQALTNFLLCHPNDSSLSEVKQNYNNLFYSSYATCWRQKETTYHLTLSNLRVLYWNSAFLLENSWNSTMLYVKLFFLWTSWLKYCFRDVIGTVHYISSFHWKSVSEPWITISWAIRRNVFYVPFWK
jgi:hypothetical protein